MKRCLTVAITCSLLLTASMVPAQQSVVYSKHNLSITGPGEIKALTEDRICVFCHTPHNANPYTPLWNRNFSSANYILYGSSTLSARPGQPSGPTRLCLSCHDGTIALGEVLSEDSRIQMTRELTANRRSYLDTDISDDHPVCFNYYDAMPNDEMAQRVPVGLKTYDWDNIHCTTCHDPHDNTYGNFLVMDNNYSALCVLCHDNKAGWALSAHANSEKIQVRETTAKTVAEWGCEGCHTPHGAGGPKRLLSHLAEEEVCYRCHDASVATFDIKAQFTKTYHHPVEATTIDVTGNYHDPAEDIMFLQGHVECVDCHNPHAANNNQAETPNASGRQNLVSGKDQNNAVREQIDYEYELCIKCHGDSTTSIPVVSRWIDETDITMEFNPVNPSYHPVVAIGKNNDMPSLPSSEEPELTATSMITCVDCHDSDESSAIGGTGPRGPHGSRYRPILRQRYDTMDSLPESEAAYALCYRCHDRSKLLDYDQSLYSTGGHRKHIVDQRAPCSACHDPHGVQNDGNGNHTHLINFDRTIVQPLTGNSFPLFADTGPRAGNCTLVCHGRIHNGAADSAYP